MRKRRRGSFDYAQGKRDDGERRRGGRRSSSLKAPGLKTWATWAGMTRGARLAAGTASGLPDNGSRDAQTAEDLGYRAGPSR
jgi:hypothetical protein